LQALVVSLRERQLLEWKGTFAFRNIDWHGSQRTFHYQFLIPDFLPVFCIGMSHDLSNIFNLDILWHIFTLQTSSKAYFNLTSISTHIQFEHILDNFGHMFTTISPF